MVTTLTVISKVKCYYQFLNWKTYIYIAKRWLTILYRNGFEIEILYCWCIILCNFKAGTLTICRQRLFLKIDSSQKGILVKSIHKK